MGNLMHTKFQLKIASGVGIQAVVHKWQLCKASALIYSYSCSVLIPNS
jgi:hypothetical protein